MFSDDDRRKLYDALDHSLGHESASILMAHLPRVGWADLATRGDLAELRGELRSEMSELRGEVHSLLPKLVADNIASMIGIAGLVLAAVSLY